MDSLKDICPGNPVERQIQWQVWEQVDMQAWLQAGGVVWNQVDSQVSGQVGRQVWLQLRWPVSRHLRNEEWIV
jgi:hypothetical protein